MSDVKEPVVLSQEELEAEKQWSAAAAAVEALSAVQERVGESASAAFIQGQDKLAEAFRNLYREIEESYINPHNGELQKFLAASRKAVETRAKSSQAAVRKTATVCGNCGKQLCQRCGFCACVHDKNGIGVTPSSGRIFCKGLL